LNMQYAKSQPRETIWEHTKLLLSVLERFQASYGHKLNVDSKFWMLLRRAVLFHDLGKSNPLFQNKIRQALGEPPLPCLLSPEEEIPHNYLSVALLPYSQLQLDKEHWKLLVYAIGYHHERTDLSERKSIQKFM